MLQTFLTALRLLWISSTDKDLKIRLTASYFFGILQGVLIFSSPLALSEMVKYIADKNGSLALFYFYVLVALSAALVLFRYIWRYACEFLSRVLPLNLQKIYYAKIFNKPYDWHLHNSVGYFSTALNNVCGMLRNWLWKLPYDYIGNAVVAVCFFIYTIFISPVLFLYFLGTLAFMIFMIRFLYNRRIKYIDASSKTDVAFGKIFIDFLYNVRSVKKMNLLGFVNEKLDQKAEKAVDAGRQMMQYNALQYGFMELFLNVQFLLPVGYYLYRFIRTGEGIEIIVMIASMQPKIGEFGRQLMSLMTELAKTQVDYKILAEHLGEDFTKPIKERAVKKLHKITFDNTQFQFVKDGSLFTHQIGHFEINKGDHVAVTGKSGEGKTTFLNLLTNQFPVEEGVALVDKTLYQDLPSSFFDDTITYISQDVELFDMTLHDNIVMGKKISTEKLQKVISGCCLNELIERMNGDMHTDIGEKGVKVSGGEKQRISLARGLLLDRDILVLDEITANLDPLTTEKIWKFIFEEYGHKTIIAVSHEKELLNHINRRIEFKKGCGTEVKI